MCQLGLVLLIKTQTKYLLDDDTFPNLNDPNDITDITNHQTAITLHHLVLLGDDDTVQYEEDRKWKRWRK